MFSHKVKPMRAGGVEQALDSYYATRKKQVVILRGIPGSGKTTWAREQIGINNGMVARVNRDDLRAMMFGGTEGYKFSKDREKMVVDERNRIVVAFLTAETDRDPRVLIVDETNLTTGHVQHIATMTDNLGGQAWVIDFFDVPVAECLRRNALRENPVPEKVIFDMVRRANNFGGQNLEIPLDLNWIETGVEYKIKEGALRNKEALNNAEHVVFCDLDGTVAEQNDRDWYDTTGKCEFDPPREIVLQVVRALCDWNKLDKVIFLTGREGTEANREGTKRWIEENFVRYNSEFGWELHMRDEGDHRADWVIKREMVDALLTARNLKVHAVFDDRPQVIHKLWLEEGFGDKLFNVGTHRWVDNVRQWNQRSGQQKRED